MNDREGKEKGGGRPEGARRKTRRVEGPVAASLESLVQMLLAFSGDLVDDAVSVQEAGAMLRSNLNDWLVRYYDHG